MFGAHSYTHYDEKGKAGQPDQGEQLVEDDPSNLIDEQGKQVLMNKLVGHMMAASNKGLSKLTNLYLEMIALMARKYVQKEWPQLFTSLIGFMQSSTDLSVYKTVFECVKKICKKYRYMFRSDALYSEMNYVIENFSGHLVNSLGQCLEMAR